MSADVAAVVLAALVCGAAGTLVPMLIRSVPEPETTAAEHPKELYAAIAGLPGLRWQAASVSAISGALAAGAVGAAWHLLVLLPLVPIGVALALIDWRTHLLPKRIVAPAYGLVVLCVLAAWLVDRDTGDLVRAGWGWAALGGLYLLMWFIYPPGMGYGDVRLAGVLGLAIGHVGWGELVVTYFAASFLGALVGLALRRGGPRRRTEYPHGPFMLAGALVGLYAGPWLGDVMAARYGL